jgi:hypothetical protein
MYGTKSRRKSVSAVIGAALVLVSATTMRAQDRHVFEWTGPVPHDADIIISGGSYLVTRSDSNARAPRGKSTLTAMPSRDGLVSVSVRQGRGLVAVVQQPQRENGFTAVIRILDTLSGTGTYHISANWQAVAAGQVSPFETVSLRQAAGMVSSRFERESYREAAGEVARFENESVRERVLASRVALMWSGNVDSELLIVIRPEGVTYETLRGEAPRAIQSAISRMPTPTSILEINQIVGRGEASIKQQPTAENGYTAIIRVRDPQPGFGHYSFMAMWR